MAGSRAPRPWIDSRTVGGQRPHLPFTYYYYSRAQALLHAVLCQIQRTLRSAPCQRQLPHVPGGGLRSQSTTRYNVALRIKLICFDSAPCLSGAARRFEGVSVSSFSHLQPTAPITTEAVCLLLIDRASFHPSSDSLPNAVPGADLYYGRTRPRREAVRRAVGLQRYCNRLPPLCIRRHWQHDSNLSVSIWTTGPSRGSRIVSVGRV